MYYGLFIKLAVKLAESNASASNMLLVAGALLCAVISYFLGSLNFGIIFSKLRYKDDVRLYGSGNAGATNMQRTYGTAAGVMTLAGDALKAVVSCIAGGFILGIIGTYISGLFCVIGHIFPVYYKFKGGKGVVTVAVMIAMTNLKVFLPILLIFLVIVIGTRYISLGSVLCAVLYPIILFKTIYSSENTNPMEYIGVLISFIVTALVVIKHSENIQRLLDHTESKISFKKKKDKGVSEKDILPKNNKKKINKK